MKRAVLCIVVLLSFTSCKFYRYDYEKQREYEELVRNVRNSQWSVRSDNGQTLFDSRYIIDFDNFRQGYMSIAYCGVNIDNEIIKCEEYISRPYVILGEYNHYKTLMVRTTDEDGVERYYRLYLSSSAYMDMTFNPTPTTEITYSTYRNSGLDFVTEQEILDKL